MGVADLARLFISRGGGIYSNNKIYIDILIYFM